MSERSQINVLFGHCHVFAQNLCQYLPEGKTFGIWLPIPEKIALSVIFTCLHLGQAHMHRFGIIWRYNQRLLREHVSQTRCHPNDDKLTHSPPLASQSSPDLDVMHVPLLNTEKCGHRTELFQWGSRFSIFKPSHDFFSIKKEKGFCIFNILQISCCRHQVPSNL